MDNEMTFTLGYKVSMTFLPVEPGTFIMGDEEEFNEYGWAVKPKHEVTITRRFWLSQFLVTRQQWRYVMGYQPYEYKAGKDLPIDNITWKEALEFCKKMTERFGSQLPDGYEFFLPTESQWEYACRTGLEPEYDLDEIAWYGACLKTRPVGQKKPNRWGLYDMLGNVWEWCYDWNNVFPEDFRQVKTKRFTSWTDPVGLGEEFGAAQHIARGGHYHSTKEECTPCFRKDVTCGEKSKHIGFRVAIRPAKGYSYWDEWGEVAALGYAVEEGESGAESTTVNMEDYGKSKMFLSVVSSIHKDDPAQWYFKIYDHYHWSRAEKEIRICFTKPEYIFYRNTDEKKDWILSAEEKKHLMEILTKDNNGLWKSLIYNFNNEVLQSGFYEYYHKHNDNGFDGIPEDLPIPDYTKLPDTIEKR